MKRILAIFIFFIILWQSIIFVFHLPHYILPSPLETAHAFIQNFSLIMTQAKPTLIETLLSLTLAIIIGLFAAITLALLKPARQYLLPLLIIAQAFPTFAIAPLFVLWFGYGISSKIAITLLMIFFPITNSLYDGLQNTPKTWLELSKTMNASPWRTLWHIQLPAALPSFATGLRYAAMMAPLGAVLGEWVGSSEGLGYLILNSEARVEVALMFASIMVVALLSLGLYFSVDALLKKYIPWRQER